MNELALLEILRGANEGVDSNFQFWLSSSFAVLMAFFFAGEKIVGYVKWAVLFLYLTSTILFAFRIQATGRLATRARAALEEIDSEFLTIGADVSAYLVGGSFFAIILMGTVATVYFCLNSAKIMRK